MLHSFLDIVIGNWIWHFILSKHISRSRYTATPL